jgi:hypothetical protein
MAQLSPSERTMWQTTAVDVRRPTSDDDVNEKYASRDVRIITETNREQLLNFVEALKRHDWMDLRPFYQRRRRWDPVRQSRLIESFVMNVPIPPLFVFESDLAKYEVMDGQQRITAISEFYENTLQLRGLQQWPELNGRTYATLPSLVRKGIDRRTISYIVLLKESAGSPEDQAFLRQQVFERLNTGGVVLSHQEIRNCLYHGPFNDLLLRLSKSPLFRVAWKLPEYGDAEQRQRPPAVLLRNPFFSKMTDVEVILRFFALRHAEHYQRGMHGFLDLYMVKTRALRQSDLVHLEEVFTRTLQLALDMYVDRVFCPWDTRTERWTAKPHIAFADAVMVGLCRHLPHENALRHQRRRVVEETRRLFTTHPGGTFTGRGNTKVDVNTRIDLFSGMLTRITGRVD